MKTTYINGDKVKYTGKSSRLHGATAYEVLFLEGSRMGKPGVTYRAPGVAHYNGDVDPAPNICPRCKSASTDCGCL